MKQFVTFIVSFLCILLLVACGRTNAPIETPHPFQEEKEKVDEKEYFFDDENELEEEESIDNYDIIDVSKLGPYDIIDYSNNPEIVEAWRDSLDLSKISQYDLEEYTDFPEIVEEWLECHDLFDYMEWEEVESSAIKEIGYAGWPFNALGIRFVRNSDPIYVYYEVPFSVYDELVNADSIGKYYNSDIKDQYECDKFE